jgi:hypothetical protein
MVSHKNTDPSDQPNDASPAQGELFDMPPAARRRTPEEIAELAHKIGETAAARPSPLSEEPDATERWLIERGGGTNRDYPPGPTPKPMKIRPPRKPLPRFRGRIRDGDSGLDPFWNVHPVELSIEGLEALRQGVALMRAGLAEQQPAPPELSSALARPEWAIPQNDADKLTDVMNDKRAGFTFKTQGEGTLAQNMKQYMRIQGGPDVIDRHVIAERERILRQQLNRGKTRDEAAAEADKRELRFRQSVDHYADDSLRVLTATKGLSDLRGKVLLGQEQGLSGASSLAEVAAMHPEAVTGILAVAQRNIIRHMTAHGSTPVGVDPLRNLGTRFEAVASMITEGSFPNTKQGIVAKFIAEWMASTSVLDVQDSLRRTREDEVRRRTFWVRVQKGMPPKVVEDEQGSLN